MGKSESAERSFNRIEAGQAHNIRSRQKENRSRSASKVGEGEGAANEGGLEYWNRKPAAQLAGFPSSLPEISPHFTLEHVSYHFLEQQRDVRDRLLVSL